MTRRLARRWASSVDVCRARSDRLDQWAAMGVSFAASRVRRSRSVTFGSVGALITAPAGDDGRIPPNW